MHYCSAASSKFQLYFVTAHYVSAHIVLREVVVFFHDTPMVCVCVCAILMRAFVEFYSIDMNLPQSVAVFIVGADAA